MVAERNVYHIRVDAKLQMSQEWEALLGGIGSCFTDHSSLIGSARDMLRHDVYCDFDANMLSMFATVCNCTEGLCPDR